jgi:hypothetical protein
VSLSRLKRDCILPVRNIHLYYHIVQRRSHEFVEDILMSHLPPRGDQLPSMEHMSGSVVGVGSLPGQRNEKAVALTPEERQHPAGMSTLARYQTDTSTYFRPHSQIRFWRLTMDRVGRRTDSSWRRNLENNKRRRSRKGKVL